MIKEHKMDHGVRMIFLNQTFQVFYASFVNAGFTASRVNKGVAIEVAFTLLVVWKVGSDFQLFHVRLPKKG